MIKLIKLRLASRVNLISKDEFERCVEDLLKHEKVLSMKNYIQHGSVSCFEHCLNVSYTSYKICRFLGFDHVSAARGALLHDFFLYDWHVEKLERGLHGFVHPEIALENAVKYFELNELEKDIIRKHMWPLTIKFPKHKESLVVQFADKFCAIAETFTRRKKIQEIKFENKILAENIDISEPNELI